MKKIILGIGIVTISGKEELVKSWNAVGNKSTAKNKIHRKLRAKAKFLLKEGEKIDNLKQYVFVDDLSNYCSILEVRKENKIYFGVGFSAHQIGAEITADMQLTKKTISRLVPVADTKTMIKDARVLHRDYIKDFLKGN